MDNERYCRPLDDESSVDWNRFDQEFEECIPLDSIKETLKVSGGRMTATYRFTAAPQNRTEQKFAVDADATIISVDPPNDGSSVSVVKFDMHGSEGSVRVNRQCLSNGALFLNTPELKGYFLPSKD